MVSGPGPADLLPDCEVFLSMSAGFGPQMWILVWIKPGTDLRSHLFIFTFKNWILWAGVSSDLWVRPGLDQVQQTGTGLQQTASASLCAKRCWQMLHLSCQAPPPLPAQTLCVCAHARVCVFVHLLTVKHEPSWCLDLCRHTDWLI